MLLGTFLLVLVICLGLLVTSLNMEKVTLRHGQDFFAIFPREKGVWEVRFLGSALTINQAIIIDGIKVRLTRGINYLEGVVNYLRGL